MTQYAAVGAMVTGLLLATPVAMSTIPFVLARAKDDGDYQIGDDFKDVPMDSPQRQPDWCHSHGQTYPCDGEEK